MIHTLHLIWRCLSHRTAPDTVAEQFSQVVASSTSGTDTHGAGVLGSSAGISNSESPQLQEEHGTARSSHERRAQCISAEEEVAKDIVVRAISGEILLEMSNSWWLSMPMKHMVCQKLNISTECCKLMFGELEFETETQLRDLAGRDSRMLSEPVELMLVFIGDVVAESPPSHLMDSRGRKPREEEPEEDQNLNIPHNEFDNEEESEEDV
eukprot:TRINITY_DN6046_c0_g1_i1.p1 TRINITY_DN6046_c0_g1~~TRINITY_DN6046_c0_g1_i1.p1  ORF type:complete len:210 (+),score=47.03 TRINITY_DN6046_c0_g1_i1:54-683(+)